MFAGARRLRLTFNGLTRTDGLWNRIAGLSHGVRGMRNVTKTADRDGIIEGLCVDTI